jgi:rhodanese-related sulfurtransferase
VNHPLEVSVEEFDQRLKSGDALVILDVREEWELKRAALDDSRLEVRPLSRLSKEGVAGLPEAARSPAAEIYVLCHYGARSADVAAWLMSQGWNRTFSVAGGMDAYARRIDASVGRY